MQGLKVIAGTFGFKHDWKWIIGRLGEQSYAIASFAVARAERR